MRSTGTYKIEITFFREHNKVNDSTQKRMLATMRLYINRISAADMMRLRLISGKNKIRPFDWGTRFVWFGLIYNFCI